MGQAEYRVLIVSADNWLRNKIISVDGQEGSRVVGKGFLPEREWTDLTSYLNNASREGWEVVSSTGHNGD